MRPRPTTNRGYLRVPDGGATEVSYSWATDTSDGGRTSGSASDGQSQIGNVTETTDTGQGRDGGAVRRLVLQPGTLATGSLMARGLGNGSGRGVGQTSGLTVRRASGPEFPPCQDHGAGGSVNCQTGGLTHAGTVTPRNARWRSLSPSPPDAGRRRGKGRGGAFGLDSPLSSSRPISTWGEAGASSASGHECPRSNYPG